MKKFISILLLSIITLFIIAPFMVIESVKALPLDPSDYASIFHKIAAQDNGSKIIDSYYDTRTPEQSRTSTTAEFSFLEWVGEKYIKAPATDTFFYTFNNITTRDVPYTFGVDSTTLTWNGIYKFDYDKKIYFRVGIDDLDSDDKLSSSARLYIASLIQFWNVGGHMNIANMTFNSTEKTSFGIDCPDLQLIKSVDYSDANGTKTLTEANFEGDEYTLYKDNKIPADAKAKLYYKPSGAPYYKAIAEFPIKPDGKVDIKYSNLRKGNYYVTAYWALAHAENSTKYAFDNLQSGLDPVTRYYRDNFPKSSWLETATTGLNTAITIITKGAVKPVDYSVYFEINELDLIYDRYGGSSTEFVVGDTPLDSSTCNNFPFDVKYLQKIVDEGTGERGDQCGSVNAQYLMNWAFCIMLVSVQALANWAQEKSFSIFGTMTNIEVNKDTTPATTPDATSPPTTFNDQKKSKVLVSKQKNQKQHKFISRVYV